MRYEVKSFPTFLLFLKGELLDLPPVGTTAVLKAHLDEYQRTGKITIPSKSKQRLSVGGRRTSSVTSKSNVFVSKESVQSSGSSFQRRASSATVESLVEGIKARRNSARPTTEAESKENRMSLIATDENSSNLTGFSTAQAQKHRRNSANFSQRSLARAGQSFKSAQNNTSLDSSIQSIQRIDQDAGSLEFTILPQDLSYSESSITEVDEQMCVQISQLLAETDPSRTNRPPRARNPSLTSSEIRNVRKSIQSARLEQISGD